MATARARVVLVSGMSGAGRSTGLKVLEDLGYEAIDNLPLSLLSRLLHPRGEGGLDPGRPLAVDVDIRSRGFHAANFVERLVALTARGDLDLRLVFFDCDDEVLSRRFTATRRRHPLAEDRPLSDGIRLEREMLIVLRQRADLVIDTSQLALPELRALLRGHFAFEGGPRMTVSLMSFSYAQGIPREADIVFDVRFLANPHYDDRLRQLSGLNAAVGAYIEADSAFAAFFGSLSGLLLSLLPHYVREGKTYLTIAFGCTGGRHRSVFIAERFAALMRQRGQAATLRHRDLGQDGEAGG